VNCKNAYSDIVFLRALPIYVELAVICDASCGEFWSCCILSRFLFFWGCLPSFYIIHWHGVLLPTTSRPHFYDPVFLIFVSGFTDGHRNIPPWMVHPTNIPANPIYQPEATTSYLQPHWR